MPAGPCSICGARNYSTAYGGADICPSCDSGAFKRQAPSDWRSPERLAAWKAADPDAISAHAPPTLPHELLKIIGEYGMARTDGVGMMEVTNRWEALIRAIKRYAADVAASASPVAPPVVEVPAQPDANVHLVGNDAGRTDGSEGPMGAAGVHASSSAPLDHRGNCADGTQCLHSCLTTEPCLRLKAAARVALPLKEQQG
jgi:hypothetical protein